MQVMMKTSPAKPKEAVSGSRDVELYLEHDLIEALEGGKASILQNFSVMAYEEDFIKCYVAFPPEFILEVEKKVNEGGKPLILLKLNEGGVTAVLSSVDKMSSLVGLKREDAKPDKTKRTDEPSDYI